ncbi:unnamed protein product [Adineta steineri]|uniref:Lysosomal protein NCU-G1 n=1 Tax=Adineta steineri TaxID=433720 RepID=A0A818QKX4_9BILA|nr:unnamed protein product [Adineta steineri]CAF3636505.1 unnamed protein product [Adineta steineri]
MKTIYSSVPFIMNPGCDLPQCKTPGQPAIFYANHYVGDDTIHILYSSLDELTISIIQTKKGYGPHINYTALFNRNYRDSISFGETTPINSLSLILRRLLRFNDINDTGYLNPNDTTIQSYWLNDLSTNITYRDNNTDQPSFQLLLKEKDINGLLTIDINYPGESIRDTKFPKLRSTPKSYFLNIALKADNYTSPKTRFAMEYYIIQLGVEGTQLSTSKYIDDQYTPGIFNVWRVESLSPIYLSSMLWKPVVYQSDDRSIEKNTLMNVYNLSNKIDLQPLIDQGIFIALYKKPYVSAFNVSFGRANDGFFTKSNYTFIQFTAGLEILQTDSIKQFVTLALLLSLAIPCLVAVIAFIFIMKRRCTRQNTTSYDIIDD